MLTFIRPLLPNMLIHAWPTICLIALLTLSLQTNASPRILIVGDSISAGFGVPLENHWPQLLEQKLREKIPELTVLTAAISGDTTSGGLNRLPPLLQEQQPDLVIIALGGNDALRGTSLVLVRNNLEKMTKMAKNSGAQVVLAGMQIPPNYGQTYTDRFRAIYPAIAKKEEALLIPFLLEKIATVPTMMQPDGIHPATEAQPQLAENVINAIRPWLAQQLLNKPASP